MTIMRFQDMSSLSLHDLLSYRHQLGGAEVAIQSCDLSVSHGDAKACRRPLWDSTFL